MHVPNPSSVDIDPTCGVDIPTKLWVLLRRYDKNCAPRAALCSQDDDDAASVCTRIRDGFEVALIGDVAGRGYINVSDDLRGSGVYDASAANARAVPMISVDDLVADRPRRARAARRFRPPAGLSTEDCDGHGRRTAAGVRP